MQLTINTSSIGRFFGVSLSLVMAMLIYVQIMFGAGRVLADPDTYLHIVIGRWMLSNNQIPRTGIFSGTMADAPWVAHEWLAEVALSWIFDRLEWTGLVVVTALCTIAALAFLFRALLRFIPPIHAVIAVSLAYFLLLPHILARPEIFTLPILIAWSAALVSARNQGRAPHPSFALLMLIWANLHGGYLLGLALAALFAGEALIEASDWQTRVSAARSWALFCMLSLGAALITPFGIEGLLLPFRLAHMNYALSMLVEWRSPDFQSLQPLEVWLVIFLFSALCLGWRLSWTRVLMLVILLHLSLQHRRFGGILGLVSPLLIAPSIAVDLRARGHSRIDEILDRLARPARPGGIALAGFLLLACTIALPRSAFRPSDGSTPVAAISVSAANDVNGLVLNDYRFGGYLIFSGIKPFIDGRAELYGDMFIRRYSEALLLTNDQLTQILQEYRVCWTLLEPDRPAVRLTILL